MARTTLTKSTALGPFGAYTGTAARLTMAAGDNANGNQFAVGPRELVVAHNTSAGALTLTVTSVADARTGRTGDITTYSIPAGEYAIFGPFGNDGWGQSDGYVYLTPSATTLKLGVVSLPAM